MQQVNAGSPGFYPSAVNGGMSSWLTSTFLSTNPSSGQAYIKDFLQAFPDAHFVTLNLGTNDVNGGVSASTVLANMETLVQDVIAAGRVPVVPTIPWAPSTCSANLANDNPATPGTANYAIVNTLYNTYPQVVHGPDLWTYFNQHPSEISTSGSPGCPHPTEPTGENDYRSLWASTMLAEVYP
jgi:lysophospholipase L1-like esterase